MEKVINIDVLQVREIAKRNMEKNASECCNFEYDRCGNKDATGRASEGFDFEIE